MRSSSRIAGALALVAATAGAASRARVTVRPDAMVAADTIRLGDVAVIEGAERDDLAAVTLGPAPAAGESRTLDGAGVLDAVRRRAGGLDGITYTVPAVVRVRRASQDVPASAVRAAVEAFLGETLGPDATLHDLDVPDRCGSPRGRIGSACCRRPGSPSSAACASRWTSRSTSGPPGRCGSRRTSG